ncbi:MAG: TIGR04282 family arsenosugar biosynthesis glycosyltransferase [Acidimicrobiia bacterium]
MQVLVMAKAPEPGRVKTRLCPPCAPAEAAAVAAAALADTLDAALASGAERVVLALDGRPGPWVPPGVVVVEQGTGAFGQRLAAAWRAAGGPGIQIGMDTPQVGAGDLDAAMATLAGAGVDAVLGPAADGGWWCIGLHRADDAVFAGVPFNRSDTGARQRARMGELGLNTVLLPTRRDVDVWDDALAVAALAPAGRFAAAVGAVGWQEARAGGVGPGR